MTDGVIAEQNLHRTKVTSAFNIPKLMRSMEVQERLRGDTAETGDPNWPNGYSRCMTSCSFNKVGRRRRKRETVWWCDSACFPSNSSVWWGPAFLVMAEHLSTPGKQWMNFLLLCLSVWLLLSLRNSLSQYTNFLAFMPLIFSLIQLVGDWMSAWYLVAGWG